MRHATLGDTLYFHFAVNSTAGEATDATGSPAFYVRKGGAAANAAPTLDGSATLLEHANYPSGLYEIAVAATGGNGFESDSQYSVFCQASVSSVNPAGLVGEFILAPVPADAKKIGGQNVGLSSDNRLRVDVAEWNDIPLGTTNPLPNAAADAAGGLPISDLGGLDLDTLLARLDAAISSRMASYTQPTGFLSATFQSTVASQADIAAITQAQRVRLIVPASVERPDSGSTTYRLYIFAYNEQHEAEDLDANPTVTVENNAGTDRSSNLGVVTKPGATTGQYYVDYTVADSHAIEGLLFKVDAVEGGETTRYAVASLVVDTTAVDFTAADRAKLEAVHAKMPSKTYITGTNNSDGDVQLDEATGQNTLAAAVRDVNNQTPAANSLGAAVNSATAPTVQQIVDGVLDEPTADHQDAGSVGKAISDAGGGSITLTNNIVVPATVADEAQNADSIICIRGDTLRRALNDNGDLTGRTDLWLTIKADQDANDDAAFLQVTENDGLVVYNGSNTVPSAAYASLTVTNEANADIAFFLHQDLTKLFTGSHNRTYSFDLQVKDGGDVTTLRSGSFKVVRDVTRSV